MLWQSIIPPQCYIEPIHISTRAYFQAVYKVVYTLNRFKAKGIKGNTNCHYSAQNLWDGVLGLAKDIFFHLLNFGIFHNSVSEVYKHRQNYLEPSRTGKWIETKGDEPSFGAAYIRFTYLIDPVGI